MRWPGRASGFERDPAWSPDGRKLAFAARIDDSGFDLYVVDAGGGEPRRVTSLAGDERWPSWLPDGRLVFANRGRGQWDLHAVDPAGPSPNVERLTDTTTDETEPRVSPDGRLVVFVSTADAADGEADLWLLQLSGRAVATAGGVTRPDPTPLIRERGAESSPAWAPDGARLAYAVTQDGAGSIRIVDVEAPEAGVGRADDALALPIVVSRHPGQVAWSPDGQHAARHGSRRAGSRLQRPAAARR